jgi:hypothetical protein
MREVCENARCDVRRTVNTRVARTGLGMIALSIALAACAAHSQRYEHRDLPPQGSQEYRKGLAAAQRAVATISLEISSPLDLTNEEARAFVRGRYLQYTRNGLVLTARGRRFTQHHGDDAVHFFIGTMSALRLTSYTSVFYYPPPAYEAREARYFGFTARAKSLNELGRFLVSQHLLVASSADTYAPDVPEWKPSDPVAGMQVEYYEANDPEYEDPSAYLDHGPKIALRSQVMIRSMPTVADVRAAVVRARALGVALPDVRKLVPWERNQSLTGTFVGVGEGYAALSQADGTYVIVDVPTQRSRIAPREGHVTALNASENSSL